MNAVQEKTTAELMARFYRGMEAGTIPACVIREFINSREPSEAAPVVSPADIASLFNRVVGTSVLTMSGNLIMPMAWLGCAADGPSTQDAIYNDLMDVYDGDLRGVWEGVVTKERSPCLTAFIKESLRYWSVLPMTLACESVCEVYLPGGVVIPPGIEFHMNAWAGNIDPARFSRPHVFDLERYLDVAQTDLDHLSFGACSRMCPGRYLATRIVYAMLGRMILAYRVGPPSDLSSSPVLDSLGSRVDMNGLALDPKPYKVTLTPRETFDMKKEVVGEAKMAREGASLS